MEHHAGKKLNLVKLFCSVTSSSKAVLLLICTYRLAHVPGAFSCNLNGIFLLFNSKSSQPKSKQLPPWQLSIVVCEGHKALCCVFHYLTSKWNKTPWPVQLMHCFNMGQMSVWMQRPKPESEESPCVTLPWPQFDLCFPNYIQVVTLCLWVLTNGSWTQRSQRWGV